MTRIRAEITIDGDAASPDSIAAAHEYIVQSLLGKSLIDNTPLDWNKYRTYVKTRRRSGDLTVVGFAPVL